jgi:hypothetical protein
VGFSEASTSSGEKRRLEERGSYGNWRRQKNGKPGMLSNRRGGVGKSNRMNDRLLYTGAHTKDGALANSLLARMMFFDRTQPVTQLLALSHRRQPLTEPSLYRRWRQQLKAARAPWEASRPRLGSRPEIVVRVALFASMVAPTPAHGLGIDAFVCRDTQLCRPADR